MIDLSSTALSGLKASQTSLSVTSNNIVNIDTDGYSRQVAGQGTRIPQFIGGSFIGTGVDITSIERISNQYVVDQMRRDTASFNSYDAYYEYAVKLDNLLGSDSTALTPSMQKFFDSLQGLSNDPSSVAQRQALISSGQALANRFNSVYDQVFQTNETLNKELSQVTSKITQLSRSIASYNETIRSVSTNSTGEMPNDLLDKRDEAVRQLSELVGVNVVDQGDNTISVFVGNGQPLVVGTEAYGMQTIDPNTGMNRSEMTLGNGGATVNVTDLVSGGRLGGLLSVREELIDPVFNDLGRIAMVLSDTFNAQHELGMDLDNQLGANFFSDINSSLAETSRVAPSATNIGSPALSVTITDTSQLTTDNYRLAYDGGSNTYTLYNGDDAAVATLVNPTAGDTISADGFEINIGAGAPVDGDEFAIMPTRMGASNIGVDVNDVRKIAAALPVTTNLPSTNIGTGYVDSVVVTDTTTADFSNTQYALDPQYRIEFTTGTDYNVVDTATNTTVGTGVFTPSQPNNLLANAGLANTGYDIVFSGNPAANDVVNIAYNNGGVSDNRNALLLGDLANQKTVGNGNASYQGAYAQLVSGVGTRTNDAEVSHEAAQTILNQVQAQWESISGVNLDEEAANLMKFQQSYQASARVLQVSSELFDTILGSL